ncbi:MAG: hypothetical protein IKQ46_14375 [Bacteroidales bacterium]|nr:hypothetical protein [Bacteroidales bacterium]
MSKLIANFGCNNNYAMKTNKEYPATHSMSTAWFAADEDGNVAIFDFNENGPVPQCASVENLFESMMANEIAEEPITNGMLMPSVKFTDEQLWELSSNYLDEDISKYKVGDCIDKSYIKIKENKFDEFIEELNNNGVFDSEFYCIDDIVCLSKNQGILYIQSGIEITEKLLSLIEKVGYAAEFIVFDNSNESTKNDDYDCIKPYMPFYIFAQPYCTQNPMKRVFEPKFPFKIAQLPKHSQGSITILPIKFSEHNYLQIAEYLPIFARTDWGENDVSYEVFPQQSFSFKYAKLSNATEGTSYYLMSSVLNAQIFVLAQTEHQASFAPTIFVIAEPFDGMYWKGTEGFINFFAKNYVYLPIIWSSSEDYESKERYRNYSSEEKIKNFSKSYIENNIRFFNPYLILIKDEIKFVLEHYYKLENHQITINNQTFPYFLFSEMEQHRDEILEYSNKEYRGIKIPTKLTKSEMKKY